MLQTETSVVDAGSFRDPSGHVFRYGDRIFRAVTEECLQLVLELRASGLLSRLIEDGLVVGTTVIEDPSLLQELHAQHPGFSGFLEHDRIDPITYPYEWSPSMLAAAGICTLDLQLRLLEHGYSLKDATAYNIQFVSGRPIFIDVPSIERAPRLDIWIALGQFGRMFTNPLMLNRYKGRTLRSYFLAQLDGSGPREVAKAFGAFELLNPRLLLDVTLPCLLERRAERASVGSPRAAAKANTSAAAQVTNLRRLRAKLLKLMRPTGDASHWVGYTGTCSYSDQAEEAKVAAITAYLRKHRPSSVVDIGCNTGRYSELAAATGAQVIAADSDADCIDALHNRLKDMNYPVLPLCIDIANPSPAIGFRNQERMRFLDRVQGECVFALALIHHLHVSANLPLAGIRDLLCDVTHRDLVLEFVPTQDVMFQKLLQFRTDDFASFTLEACLRVFAEKFDLLDQAPIADSPRTLLFFRRK